MSTPWSDSERWTVEERRWPDAPDADFTYAVIDERGEVRAWLRDPGDARMVARVRREWPEVQGGAGGVRGPARGERGHECA